MVLEMLRFKKMHPTSKEMQFFYLEVIFL